MLQPLTLLIIFWLGFTMSVNHLDLIATTAAAVHQEVPSLLAALGLHGLGTAGVFGRPTAVVVASAPHWWFPLCTYGTLGLVDAIFFQPLPQYESLVSQNHE